MPVGCNSGQVPAVLQAYFPWFPCCWEILGTQIYRLIPSLTNRFTTAQEAAVKAILYCSSNIHSCQCGEVASSARKFVLHPSEKMLAGFACGLIAIGRGADTIKLIVDEMGGMYRWQWLLVTNMCGDPERWHKSQPVPWARGSAGDSARDCRVVGF